MRLERSEDCLRMDEEGDDAVEISLVQVIADGWSCLRDRRTLMEIDFAIFSCSFEIDRCFEL